MASIQQGRVNNGFQTLVKLFRFQSASSVSSNSWTSAASRHVSKVPLPDSCTATISISNARWFADFRIGSIATEMGCPRYVRFPMLATAERTSRNVSNVPITEVERLYSKTSSARARRDGGISTPSDFAVLRLIASRYLEGCSIGSSAGLAPFSIRST
jgi:hypothetical protein